MQNSLFNKSGTGFSQPYNGYERWYRVPPLLQMYRFVLAVIIHFVCLRTGVLLRPVLVDSYCTYCSRRRRRAQTEKCHSDFRPRYVWKIDHWFCRFMTPTKPSSSRDEKFLHKVVVLLYLTAIWWDESSKVLEVVFIIYNDPKRHV